MNLKKIIYVYSHYFQKLSLKGGNKESLFFFSKYTFFTTNIFPRNVLKSFRNPPFSRFQRNSDRIKVQKNGFIDFSSFIHNHVRLKYIFQQVKRQILE